MIPGLFRQPPLPQVHRIAANATGYDLFLEMGSPAAPLIALVLIEPGVLLSGGPLVTFPLRSVVSGVFTASLGISGFADGTVLYLINQGRTQGYGGQGGWSRAAFIGGGTNFQLFGGGGGGGAGSSIGEGQEGYAAQPASVGADGTLDTGGAGGTNFGSTGIGPFTRVPTNGFPGGTAIGIDGNITVYISNGVGEIFGGGGGGAGAEMVFGETTATGGDGGDVGEAGGSSIQSSSTPRPGGAAGAAIEIVGGSPTIVVTSGSGLSQLKPAYP